MPTPGRETDATRVGLVGLHSAKFPFIGESHGICAIAGYLREHFPRSVIDTFDLQLVDIGAIVDHVERTRPALLGVSVKMQTFNQLCELESALRARVPRDRSPLLVLGGAVANFNSEAILEQYLPDVVVGIGEGELAMADLYRHVGGDLALADARNIAFRDRGGIRPAHKTYLDAAQVALPDRSHSFEFYRRGGEVYTEASRGCAYGLCTFCGCSDFLGSWNKSQKWRPRPTERVVADFEQLAKLGIGDVTFADEEFFGLDADGLRRAQDLARALQARGPCINFRVNAWVKSLFKRSDPPEIRSLQDETVRLLKAAGLVKVFLGLESGVESQLRRYGKGFNLEEFIGAYGLLKKYGIDCEFGFILLDPLMNLEELDAALGFLEANGLVHEISSIYKELRVQVGNAFIRQVRAAEQRTGVEILGDVDFNEQEFRVLRYLDPNVEFLRRFLRGWTDRVYRLYYLLRIFTQYSEQPSASVAARTFGRSICFETIHEIRSIEFQLLRAFVDLLRKSRNEAEGRRLIRSFEARRQAIVTRLVSALSAASKPEEVLEIQHEAEIFLRASDLSLTEMDAPCETTGPRPAH